MDNVLIMVKVVLVNVEKNIMENIVKKNIVLIIARVMENVQKVNILVSVKKAILVLIAKEIVQIDAVIKAIVKMTNVYAFQDISEKNVKLNDNLKIVI